MKKSTACRRPKGFIGYATFANALFVPRFIFARIVICANFERFRSFGAA